jgi:undecaprenyl-diphosphatase
MILEFILDVGKLLLIVYCLRLAIRTYVRIRRPNWSAPLAKRDLAVLLILALAAVTVKLIEDVFTGESGFIDRATLISVHRLVPAKLTGFFEWVTFTGSSTFLLPLAAGSTIAMFLAKRRFDAFILSASVLGAAAVVYLIKIAANRARPALWETDWYWGSSFPSGHTLVVAAFATAIALYVKRSWPRAQTLAIATAASWIGLVALSRLVLGVHWPTDVLAAACMGATLPLAMSVALDLKYTNPSSMESSRK